MSTCCQIPAASAICLFPSLLLDLVERAIRFADKDPKTMILIGFICSKARHRSVACKYLMQVIHTAFNYTVNTRTTAIASSGRHVCNRDTCPDCSHLSVAAVRLMESVRERLVASWNKAVASAVSTLQHPKQSVTLTSTRGVRKLSLNCLFAEENINKFDLCRPPGINY